VAARRGAAHSTRRRSADGSGVPGAPGCGGSVSAAAAAAAAARFALRAAAATCFEVLGWPAGTPAADGQTMAAAAVLAYDTVLKYMDGGGRRRSLPHLEIGPATAAAARLPAVALCPGPARARRHRSSRHLTRPCRYVHLVRARRRRAAQQTPGGPPGCTRPTTDGRRFGLADAAPPRGHRPRLNGRLPLHRVGRRRRALYDTTPRHCRVDGGRSAGAQQGGQ